MIAIVRDRERVAERERVCGDSGESVGRFWESERESVRACARERVCERE